VGISENYIEYRYHIDALKNDSGYKKQVLKIREIVRQRQLASCMSDSKWIKLLDAMNNLDFPPAFLLKRLQDQIDQSAEQQFTNTVPWYFGNWQPFYQEGMPIFKTIEYLIVKPMLRQHQGRLIADKIFDQTDQFAILLAQLNVIYEERHRCFKIYGYRHLNENIPSE
jgi:hypothetical protein